MNRRTPGLCALVAAVAIFSAAITQTSPAVAVSITQFSVRGPTGPHSDPNSTPMAITEGPNGERAMWFTDPGANKIGRIGPEGYVTLFGTTGLEPSEIPPNAGIADIIATRDGNLWFTEPYAHKLAVITPEGAIKQFQYDTHSPPYPFNGEPYGLAELDTPSVLGEERWLWFTERTSSASGRFFGRINLGTYQITQFEVPTDDNTAIVKGPDGRLWYLDSNGSPSGSSRVQAINGAGVVGAPNEFGELTSTCISGLACPLPSSIAVASTGQVWVGDEHSEDLISIDPNTKKPITLAISHAGRGGVGGLASGPQGDLWFTQPAGDDIGSIEPSPPNNQGPLLGAPIAGAAPNETFEPGAQPTGIATDQEGALWITEPGVGKIARVVPPVPPTVVTGAVTSVGSTSATLNGSVTYHGVPTNYDFVFGTTPLYTSETPPTYLGDADTTSNVSVAITGLKPSTVYHYRLQAKGAVSGEGSDQTFVTGPPPPHVTVGGFEVEFHGSLTGSRLAVSKIVVTSLVPHDRVAYRCRHCFGASWRSNLTSRSGKVAFKPRSLVLNATSILEVTVTGTDGSRRIELVRFSFRKKETVSAGRQHCYLPHAHFASHCP